MRLYKSVILLLLLAFVFISWAGQIHIGQRISVGSVIPAPPVAPVASLPLPYLAWTWSGSNPDHWCLQYSDDNINWHDSTDLTGATSIAGSIRQFDVGSPGYGCFHPWCRVIGRDAGNNSITAPSNTIDITPTC